MINFCIITGINYLAKAITMYESLVATGISFDLYYVTFDRKTLESLEKLNYPHIIPVPLEDVEDQALKKVKNTRSLGEYFFTLTPSIILHTIRKYSLGQLIYIDADLYFFQSPQVLLDELGSNDILLTKHYPTSDYVCPEGRYCVQFIPFNNNERGLKPLEWWRDRCVEWCFLRAEEGKWADQGYLNDWTDRFDGVTVLKHFGATGPWNIAGVQKFADVIPLDGSPGGREWATGKTFPVVFFHFQSLKVHYDGRVQYHTTVFDEPTIELIYKPYVSHLMAVDKKIRLACPGVDPLGLIPRPKTFKSMVYMIRTQKTLRNTMNTFAGKILKRFKTAK